MEKQCSRSSRALCRTTGRLPLALALTLLAVLAAASFAEARTITGTATANKLYGTATADTVYGKGSGDTLRGLDGRDKLYGGFGNDVLSGGSRNDVLSGGPGADRLTGSGGRDTIKCGPGRDSVIAGDNDLVAADCELVEHGEQGEHPGGPGFLSGPGEWGKIELVGKAIVTDTPDLVADVAVSPDNQYAFLAHWGDPDCPTNSENSEAGGQNSPDAGAWIIDISDPANPVEVGFIPSSQDSRPGEGMQVIEMSTKWFTGDVLVMNNEFCGKNFKGGVSLWDVTNPLKPKKLSEHFGDRSALIGDVNTIHSAFAWQAGDRAFVVMTDNEEFPDVDILEITNPHRPRLIAEYDLNDFGVSQPELGLTDSFLHDMVVKEIDGRFIMLLSYWDGGFVILDVTDPANADFLGDSEFTNPDPELLQQLGVALTPEGNAHQAEFTIDNRFVIGTDEDFAPFRLTVVTDDGDQLHAKLGDNTTLEEALDIAGETVFVGRACPGDPAVPAGDGDDIAVVERGVCLFTEKVAAVLAAGGYEAVVIMNREGEDACTGVIPIAVEGDIPVIFVGRDSGFALFDKPFDNEACLEGDGSAVAPIAVGTAGDTITGVEETFDGWGYVHLFGVDIGAEEATLTELDTFAIPEAMDPEHAMGFGDLSVHEVAVDPQDPSLAYLSYYSGGLRAIQIEEDAATCAEQGDTAPCLVEVGGYLDPMGNDFWGVQTFVGDDGQTYILASDRDSGLWIFRDP
jgi:hypothetical protein